MPTDIEVLTYEELQRIGRQLTLQIADAVHDEDAGAVDRLLREKAEIVRRMRAARCQLN